MYNISMVTVDKFEYLSHEWVGFSQNNSHDKNIQQILYVCVYVCVCVWTTSQVWGWGLYAEYSIINNLLRT